MAAGARRFPRAGLRGAAWIALSWAVGTSAGAGEIAGTVADSAGRPLSGAVVFVRDPPPGIVLPAGTGGAVMDQVDKEFVPRVLPVVAGTAVSFPNRDQIHHHVYSFSRTKTFEIPLYKGEEAPRVVFDRPGVVRIGCNIHDWMSAVILVLPTPLFALSDRDGRFLLADLPPGRYAVAAWHESSRAGAEDDVSIVDVGGGRTALDLRQETSAARSRDRGPSLRRYE
jgi:plastocyanin